MIGTGMQSAQGRHGIHGAQSSLAINLGVDFGTSYTKVCFRDVATEETEVVTFGGNTTENAMLPSVVSIEADGRLSLGAVSEKDECTQIRFLKMGLAESELPIKPPAWQGQDLNGSTVIQALSSWFLATVITSAQTWIRENRGDRLRGRTLQWSANVGVPVEYCDSPAIETFNEVLSVGWFWARTNAIPSDFGGALARYKHDAVSLRGQVTDCHALPEIAAAVHSFVMSREALPGMYIYFDIGGGTVDGVAFDYSNIQGIRRVNFYSGKVEELGISAIANRVDDENEGDVEFSLIHNRVAHDLEEKIGSLKYDVQKLVGNIVMTAKIKDFRNWQRDALQDPSRIKRTLARLEASDMIPLPVFLGGAGAGSEWYQNAIQSTYSSFKQVNAGVPPYRLAEVQVPTDLSMSGLHSDGFRRFAIAYGLSVPIGEGPDVGLPSQFGPAEPPKQRQPGVVDYLDTKDTYD